jgi:hypothetical protein
LDNFFNEEVTVERLFNRGADARIWMGLAGGEISGDERKNFSEVELKNLQSLRNTETYLARLHELHQTILGRFVSGQLMVGTSILRFFQTVFLGLIALGVWWDKF